MRLFQVPITLTKRDRYICCAAMRDWRCRLAPALPRVHHSRVHSSCNLANKPTPPAPNGACLGSTIQAIGANCIEAGITAQPKASQEHDHEQGNGQGMFKVDPRLKALCQSSTRMPELDTLEKSGGHSTTADLQLITGTLARNFRFQSPFHHRHEKPEKTQNDPLRKSSRKLRECLVSRSFAHKSKFCDLACRARSSWISYPSI